MRPTGAAGTPAILGAKRFVGWRNDWGRASRNAKEFHEALAAKLGKQLLSGLSRADATSQALSIIKDHFDGGSSP